MAAERFTEMVVGTPRVLTESAEGGVVRFEALLSEAGHINRNRRMYPKPLLEAAVEKFKESIKQRPGAVDHPDPWAAPSLAANGILWEDVWFSPEAPDQLWGRGRIIETAKGKDLRANIEAGVEVGFSTRGTGRSEERHLSDGSFSEMVEYTLETIDAVTDPSVFHARAKTYAVTKEETEEMAAIESAGAFAEELKTSLTRAITAEAAQKVAEDKLAETLKTIEGRIEAVESAHKAALAAMLERAEKAEALVAAAAKESAEHKIDAHIIGLTQEMRFGAAIKAKIDELRGKGVTVTVENAQHYVDTFKALVEASAAQGNYGAGGNLQSNEDRASGNDSNVLDVTMMGLG
jgi:hypothetical protein